MTERPLASELAAAGWIVGGFATTIALMLATGDTHSITRGLRHHRRAFAVLVGAFLLHIYGPQVTDPFHWASAPLRRTYLRRLPNRASS